MANKGSKKENGALLRRPTCSTTKIGLYNHNGVQIQDLKEYITTHSPGTELEEYLKEKNQWDQHAFDSIA